MTGKSATRLGEKGGRGHTDPWPDRDSPAQAVRRGGGTGPCLGSSQGPLSLPELSVTQANLALLGPALGLSLLLRPIPVCQEARPSPCPCVGTAHLPRQRPLARPSAPPSGRVRSASEERCPAVLTPWPPVPQPLPWRRLSGTWRVGGCAREPMPLRPGEAKVPSFPHGQPHPTPHAPQTPHLTATPPEPLIPALRPPSMPRAARQPYPSLGLLLQTVGESPPGPQRAAWMQHKETWPRRGWWWGHSRREGGGGAEPERHPSAPRWSTCTPTTSPRWASMTSARWASGSSGPITTASASSTTPCPTGRCSRPPSAASRTVWPFSLATTKSRGSRRRRGGLGRVSGEHSGCPDGGG